MIKRKGNFDFIMRKRHVKIEKQLKSRKTPKNQSKRSTKQYKSIFEEYPRQTKKQ